MATRRRREVPCGRLGQNEAYGPTDVCKLAAGHEGPHEGRYRGMVWEDVPGRPARANISHGGGRSYVPTPGGNIRGNES